ncbi:MAG: anaerobic ribonucleoside-triphosphate reductase [Candidatus Altiarchaeales archaeon]|nr:anaerobic ribonucleoside-triphosphate reductase [Candidatus Altiarchaeales archaeon]
MKVPTLSTLDTDVNVKKADGSLEKFSPDKIITSCMNVGASFIQASQIASEVAEAAYEGMPTKEVRNIIYDKLKLVDSSMAEEYMYRLHMNVKTSKTILEKFNIQKIVDSLIKETDLDKSYSSLIAREVEKELAKMHLRHVTAPLIREIVNVKLLEHGLENARARYTRLGMPVYDVKQLIEHSKKLNHGLQYNPETVHKLMADQISREYALLSILPTELADAHMSGKLHIHDLDYFSIRPFGFSHDIRFFLKNGLKPDGLGTYTATSGPARNPEVAFLHAAKVLAASQTNCSGGQGLSHFNVYLAPYVKGLEYDKVKQCVQVFVYELSQMYAARGGQMVYSSIDLSMDIPSILADVQAVKPGGLFDGSTYSVFEEEALALFYTFVEVLSRGDCQRKAFSFPKLNIHLSKEDLKKPPVERLLPLISGRKTPCFMADRAYLPRALSYHSSAYLMPDVGENLAGIIVNNFVRGGCMQAVTLNLPQMAYEVNGSDDQLFELLEFWVKKARDILLLKINLMENNLNSGLLSFLSQRINENERYFDPRRQNHAISFTGLNEVVKAHTDNELSEKSGLQFGLRFVEKMSLLVKQLGDVSGLNFVLASTPENSFSGKMAQTDLMNHPQAVVNGEGESVYYTESYKLRQSSEVTLEQCIEAESLFSPLMNGGSLASLNLGEYSADNLSYNLARLLGNTEIQYFNFV